MAAGIMGLLEQDVVAFLATTVAVVPVCKQLNISPVLGFLAAGLALGPYGFGLLKDLSDLGILGEIGILFLLFEQGLELSVERLNSLAKYAFGLGTLQVALSTVAFTAVPFVGGLKLLETVFHANPSIIEMKRLDEAFVIGAALSLSSSAFVLKILQEKRQLGEVFGRASLGVLLLQDIAVVPLLVLLPIVELGKSGSDGGAGLLLFFSKAVAGIAALLAFGKVALPSVFGAVAGSRSSETFVALCLLTVGAAGAFTNAIGLSDTLGAFIAGILLAETNYRTQVEADIMPFRGLLLGLFFMTTGASVDPGILIREWPTALSLLTGLIVVKAVITGGLSRAFGLSVGDSARTGLLLSGGGEFAFVVLQLAKSLNVLPLELSKMLSGVVVLSMALTPALGSLGDYIAGLLEDSSAKPPSAGVIDESGHLARTEGVVVICGFGPVGQTVSSLLSSPDVQEQDIRFVAFDLNPVRVAEACRRGLPVFYGDGAQASVLRAAGVVDPRAIVVTYSDFPSRLASVKRIRDQFPGLPILTRGGQITQVYALQKAGATVVIPELSEVSIRLGEALLEEFGCSLDTINVAKETLRQELKIRGVLAAKRMLKEQQESEAVQSATLDAFSIYPQARRKAKALKEDRSMDAPALGPAAAGTDLEDAAAGEEALAFSKSADKDVLNEGSEALDDSADASHAVLPHGGESDSVGVAKSPRPARPAAAETLDADGGDPHP